MDPELPDRLKSTRELLAGSLHLHPSEEAPAVPPELLQDLVRRAPPAAATPRSDKRTFFQALQDFLAKPAFGLAAVATVIAAFAVPAMLERRSAGGPAAFRGAPGEVADSPEVRIVLVGAPAGARAALERSGDFEAGAISTATDRSGVTGAAVLVDFTAGTITARTADGAEETTPLPAAEADRAAAIAAAVSGL